VSKPAAAPASAPAAAAPAAEAAKPKSRRGLILAATAVLVLLLGGGGAAYWIFASGGEGEVAPEAAEESNEPSAAVPLEPFIVNLADAGGSRFLRVNLSLIVDEAHALEFEESAVVKAKVRSAILELLAQQTADPLITPEGKAELKKAIAESAAHAVEGLHVSDVLFSEFVVQF
jgi:flagellar FliL protein